MGVIQAAHARGFQVCVMDANPCAVARPCSDEFYAVDISDVESCRLAARTISPSAVLTTGTDSSVVSVAAIAGDLGIPGLTVEQAQELSDKERIHEVAERTGVRMPRHVSVGSVGAAVHAAGELRGPWVCKPVDRGGSRGVTVITSADSIPSAASYALAESRIGRMCLEELVEGPEFGCQVYVPAPDRVGAIWTHSDQIIAGPSPGPVGHAFPFTHPTGGPAVEDSVERLLSGIPGFVGFLNFDFIWGVDGPVLLEVGPRLGGGSLPGLLKFHTGQDPNNFVLDVALGYPRSWVSGPLMPVAARHVLSEVHGSFKGVNVPADLAAEENLLSLVVHGVVGQAVRPYLNAADAVATVYVRGDDERDAVQRALEFSSRITVEVSK